MKILDIETTGLSFKKDKIIGVGTDAGFFTDLARVNDNLKEDNELVGQNIRFDIKFLRQNGVPCKAGFDTQVAASLLPTKPGALDLATLATHYLNEQDNWKQRVNRKNMAGEKLSDVAEYCMKDVDVTRRLADKLFLELDRDNSLSFYMELIRPAYNMLIDMEQRGMHIDLNALTIQLNALTIQTAEVKSRIDAQLPGINIRSPKQLRPALAAKGLICINPVNNKESTAGAALEDLLPHPLIVDIIKFRELDKLKGYLEGWRDENVNGFLYPSYNITGTRTGRLSCSAPNLQQVPRDKGVRSLFIPRPGYTYVIADYSQIEPRIAAHYSMDDSLSKVFTENLDFYGTIAKDILGVDCHPNEVKSKYPELRAIAKEIGLSILYGIGAKKLQTRIKIGTGIVYSEAECKQFIHRYFEKYPGLKSLRLYVEKSIMGQDRSCAIYHYSKDKKTGALSPSFTERAGWVRNHFGRKIAIPKEHVFGKGVNTLVQSTASDAMLFGTMRLNRRFLEEGLDAFPTALVHDEIILECREADVERVKQLMNEELTQHSFMIPLKLDISQGSSWAVKG